APHHGGSSHHPRNPTPLHPRPPHHRPPHSPGDTRAKEPAMSDMITADLVDLDLSADTKEAAARALAERMVALGRVTDLEGFLADVAAREAQMPTGPHDGTDTRHSRHVPETQPPL